jgi:hypothetical protein
MLRTRRGEVRMPSKKKSAKAKKVSKKKAPAKRKK